MRSLLFSVKFLLPCVISSFTNKIKIAINIMYSAKCLTLKLAWAVGYWIASWIPDIFSKLLQELTKEFKLLSLLASLLIFPFHAFKIFQNYLNKQLCTYIFGWMERKLYVSVRNFMWVTKSNNHRTGTQAISVLCNQGAAFSQFTSPGFTLPCWIPSYTRGSCTL